MTYRAILTLALCTASIAVTACGGESSAVNDSSDLTGDKPSGQGPQALFEKAVRLAKKRHKSGPCKSEVHVSTLVSLLEGAVDACEKKGAQCSVEKLRAKISESRDLRLELGAVMAYQELSGVVTVDEEGAIEGLEEGLDGMEFVQGTRDTYPRYDLRFGWGQGSGDIGAGQLARTHRETEGQLVTPQRFTWTVGEGNSIVVVDADGNSETWTIEPTETDEGLRDFVLIDPNLEPSFTTMPAECEG